MKATSTRHSGKPTSVGVFYLLSLALALLTLRPTVWSAVPSPVAPAPAVSYRLPDDPRELLRLDDEMRAFFAARIPRRATLEGRIDAVLEAILGEAGLHFRYESDGVYDVREAFRRRRGNCVTYSMLVVAVAREFRIPAEFNEVTIRPKWSRSGGLVLESKHLNVHVEDTGRGTYELDLKILEDLRVSGGQAHVVDDARAFAGMYSTAGVYRLAAGEHGEALRLLERAIAIDPTSASAWANLGTAQMVIGDLGAARHCYDRALREEPSTMVAVSGLARIHRAEGRLELAEKLERKVARYRERNPYYLLSLARGELAADRLADAQRHLRRAVRIKDDEPEFYELMIAVARKAGREREAAKWVGQLAQLTSPRF